MGCSTDRISTVVTYLVTPATILFDIKGGRKTPIAL
jgi:hypothetical protein